MDVESQNVGWQARRYSLPAESSALVNCQICGEREWQDRHHRKRRSQGGTDDPVNIMYLDRVCHAAIHADPGVAYEQGYLVKSWDEPQWIEEQTHNSEGWAFTEEYVSKELGAGFTNSSAVGSEHVGETHACPAPGTSCPTCKRRVPHKHKKTSPKTKTFSCRVPIDDAVTFHEMLETAAKHAGLDAKPHWSYWTLLHGLVCLMQTPSKEL